MSLKVLGRIATLLTLLAIMAGAVGSHTPASGQETTPPVSEVATPSQVDTYPCDGSDRALPPYQQCGIGAIRWDNTNKLLTVDSPTVGTQAAHPVQWCYDHVSVFNLDSRTFAYYGYDGDQFGTKWLPQVVPGRYQASAEFSWILPGDSPRCYRVTLNFEAYEGYRKYLPLIER